MHMQVVDKLFHSELRSQLPTNNANLQKLRRNYRSSTTAVSAALGMQDAIMRNMRRISIMVVEMCVDGIVDPSIADAVMHILQRTITPIYHSSGTCWI